MTGRCGFLLLWLLAGWSSAGSLVIPLGQLGQPGTPMPRSGAHMDQVLEQFGLASRTYPAVGRPPIIRWDYPYFSVYFEHQRVICSVQHHDSPPITEGMPD